MHTKQPQVESTRSKEQLQSPALKASGRHPTQCTYTMAGRQAKPQQTHQIRTTVQGEAQVPLGPSLCMLWGLGPHGPKLPQFSPSSGPLGPRACFCSQSVHGGQWLLRGHFRLSARPSPAEGGRPGSSAKFGFLGFSPILAEREIRRLLRSQPAPDSWCCLDLPTRVE